METTTDNTQESTTVGGSSQKPPSNGNSSCPDVEDGQALFVCPTGFRRHPQDCGMFYQCTKSPETSHLSIVSFQCPNNTIYDEQAIQCVEPSENDNCQPQPIDKFRGTLFDLESHDSTSVVRINIFFK